MGKEISHIILAEQSAGSLEDSGKDPFVSILRNFSHAFHFGSIAADTFFYGIRLPVLEKRFCCCGDKIHGTDGNDTSLPLLWMLHELKANPHDPLHHGKLAFTCGFLTHVALDTVFHPCIYYLSGNYHHECVDERIRAVTRHRLIESWLDLFVLARASKTVGDCRFMENIRGNSPLNLELLRFFFEAFASTVQVERYLWKYLQRGYSVQMLLNSIYPSAFWGGLVGSTNRILKGRLDTFMALFYPRNYGEIPSEIIDFTYFRHPVTGEEVKQNFDDLWESAQQRSLEFLEAVRAYLYGDGDLARLGKVIRGYSLCMGLVGVPVSSAGYFNSVPLDRIWAY
jgi:hypothetical protein